MSKSGSSVHLLIKRFSNGESTRLPEEVHHIIMKKVVRKFEEMFGAYKEAWASITPNSRAAALHLHPDYQQKYGYTAGDFPCGEWVSEWTVPLRLSPKLTDGDVQDVIDAATAVIKEHAR